MSGAGLVRAGLVVAVITLAGRLSGLVREMALARTLGVGSEADVAVLLLTLPDLLTQVLAAGAIGAVLVPVFQGQEAQRAAYFRVFSVWAFVFGAALAVVIWLAASAVAALLAPGFADLPHQQATRGIRLVAWTLPLTAATAVTAALLQAQSRFAMVAAGTLLGNVLLIGALIVWPGSLVALGVALVAVSAVRWGSQLLALGTGVWRRVTIRPVMPPGLGRRYGEAAAAAAVIFSAPLVARSLASLDGSGGVAVFNYATRILDVPMGLALGVIPLVVFPRLSAAFADGDTRQFLQLVTVGAVVGVAVGVPIAAGLVIYGDVATRVVFGVSALEAGSLQAIAQVVTIGALGLPAVGVAFLLQSALHARLDTRGALLASGLYLVVLALAGVLGVSVGGLAGLMGVVAAGQWVFAGALWWRLRSRHGLRLVSAEAVTTVAWLVATTAVAYALPAWWTWNMTEVTPRLVAAVTGGTVAVALAALILWLRQGHALDVLRSRNR